MNEPTNKSNPAASAPGAGLRLNDIYYVLFRHKWKILACFIAGVAASAAIVFTKKTEYFSEAKLLVRYVVETKSVEVSAGSQVKSPDNGESIINSELEILKSLDLCKEVAEIIGPEKILGRENTNLMAAAVAIYGGILTDVPKYSSIIRIRFKHADPALCPEVLAQIIETYYKRHVAVHRAAATYDSVLTTREAQLLTRVRQTEQDLREKKANANIISLEDSKKNLHERMERLHQEIFTAGSELVEYQVMVDGSRRNRPASNEKDAVKVGASPDQVAEYNALRFRLDALRNKEFELLAEFTPENPLVKRLREQLATNENRRKQMEAEFPKLATLYVAPQAPATAAAENKFDPVRIDALKAKLSLLTNQLALVRQEAASLEKLEADIVDLQRRLALDEQNYKHVAAGLEAARFDEALAASKMSNIATVESPTPPAPDKANIAKPAGLALIGGLLFGLGWAWFIELVVDRTIRRSSDFESKLHLPLFLSIPRISMNGHAGLLPMPVDADLASQGGNGVALNNTWANDHPLRPFIEGLRDRTLIHFEGDPHKPKLIGVTSCGTGVGVTSMAAGLAAALSETGDGNVLFLDLNVQNQSAQPFFRGELSCGLSDMVIGGKREEGMVLHNLYAATAANTRDGDSTNLPKQLAKVVPKLRVSDYDYIVFDLPPVTPVTMTARLAGMMDLVVLVVESEKDTQDSVLQAGRLLARSKARVGAVLNKVQNPVPHWLHQPA